MTFLQTRGQFRYSNQSTDNSALYFCVKTQGEVDLIRSFNGANYNGKALNIQIKTTGGSSSDGGGRGGKASPAEVARILPQVILANYNAELRLLNLGGINAKQQSFRAEMNNIMFMKTLIRAIQETVPQVVTINFEANRIKTLAGFTFIGQALPALENLSFEDNELSDVKEIENLSKTKLLLVIFRGNPMVSDARFEAEVRMHLTSLKMLDSTPIAPLITFDVDTSSISSTSAIPPSRESFFENPAQKQWVYDFLTKFFLCYDSNRSELLRAYIDESILSITVSSYGLDKHSRDDGGGRGGRGGRGGKFGQQGEQHHGMDPTIGKYMNYSRNLAKLRDREQVRARVLTGRISILHTLGQLPASRHSKDDMVVDALTLPALGAAAQMILVTMHGHFWESQAFGSADGSNVAFDRTLVLALAPQGSEALAAGWPAMIVNDQLHIRNYIAPTSKLPGGAGAAGLGTLAMGAAPTMGAMQTQLIEKLMMTTKLRATFARQCLESVNWNYDAAVQQFWTFHSTGRVTPDMLQ
jgi:nuclear RNA export factor